MRENALREQFQVDLRGIVDILSHHLYSSERVYLRELVQNARDAIEARRLLGQHVDGSISITPARGAEKLTVRDDGVGLTREDMRMLLSMIGGTSKRGSFGATRRHFLGQFGIGLLSCFLVADTIEVLSRSARRPDAPTLRWVGHSDGTFAISEALTPLDSPGTEVRLWPRHGSHRWCNEEACTTYATDYAELLDVAVRVGPTTVSQQVAPWALPTDEQLAWCRDRFGFEAMGIIPLDVPSSGVVGLAYVLPYTARPGYRTGDRIYAKGLLVADTDDSVVPQWAFFCRAVIDAGDLPLTAGREALQESASLQLVRTHIGFRLLTELIVVQGSHPDVFMDVVRLHSGGLKALAAQQADVLDLLRYTLPFTTSVGERSIQQLVDGPGPAPFVRDADAYAAIADIAGHAGAVIIDASGPHEAELLEAVNAAEGEHFREIDARFVVDLVKPVPHDDGEAADALVARTVLALDGEDVTVRLASFDPADRPVLWWPASAEDPDRRGTLILNAANPAVKRLLDSEPGTDLTAELRALYVAGLLLGRKHPEVRQTAMLTAALQAMIDSGRA
jgi:molecular chaperone HtpG